MSRAQTNVTSSFTWIESESYLVFATYVFLGSNYLNIMLSLFNHLVSFIALE